MTTQTGTKSEAHGLLMQGCTGNGEKRTKRRDEKGQVKCHAATNAGRTHAREFARAASKGRSYRALLLRPTFSPIRALISFRTRAAGIALSAWKRIVPLLMS